MMADLPTTAATSTGASPWHQGKMPCVSCGAAVSRDTNRCPNCGQDLSPPAIQKLSRVAGNWFVYEAHRPLPGVRLELLIRQAQRGNLSRDTVVRGPTTHQQWRFAGETQGLSHYVGLCWFCGEVAEPNETHCRTCHSSFSAQEEAANSRVQPAPALAPAALAPAALASVPMRSAAVPPTPQPVADLPALFAEPPRMMPGPGQSLPVPPGGTVTASGMVPAAGLPGVPRSVPSYPPYRYEQRDASGPSGKVVAGIVLFVLAVLIAILLMLSWGEPETLFVVPTTEQPGLMPATAPAGASPAPVSDRVKVDQLWELAERLSRSDNPADVETALATIRTIRATVPEALWPPELQAREQLLSAQVPADQPPSAATPTSRRNVRESSPARN